jgi:peptide/nickel transport system permease protein
MRLLPQRFSQALPLLQFILRRVLYTIPLILGISLIAFGVMQLAPGDYLSMMRGNPQVSEQTIEELRRAFGLDKPWWMQYVSWLRNALFGNFGYSFTYKMPVFELIGTFTLNTLILAVTTMIFSWVVAIPMGVYAATHKNGTIDRLVSIMAYGGISLPAFFVALLALMMAQRTGWFPVGGKESADFNSLSNWEKFLDVGKHLILPTLVLGTRGVASIMRQMRGNLLDVLGENYILAARARGLSEKVVILKHGVRNAINPLITIFGFEIAGLLAGAALVEKVMAWPGLGFLLLTAVLSQDLYVAMGAFMMGAALLIMGNLIADILLAITDPRIKFA